MCGIKIRYVSVKQTKIREKLGTPELTGHEETKCPERKRKQREYKFGGC